MIPCTGNISKCPPQQWAQVQAYSPQFMDQFLANINPDSQNGAFLDACLIHGSTSTPIDGLTNAQAFQSWLAGNATYGCVICRPTPAPFGVHPVPRPPPTHPTHPTSLLFFHLFSNWWVQKCDGSILTGPCDTGKSCQTFPH